MAKEIDSIIPQEPTPNGGDARLHVVSGVVSPKVAAIFEGTLTPTRMKEGEHNLDAKFEGFSGLIQDIPITIDNLGVMRFRLNDGTHLVGGNIGKRLIFRYENPGNQVPNVQEGVDVEVVKYYSLYEKYGFEFDTDWAIGNESGDGKGLSFTLLSKSNETSKSIEALLKSIDPSDGYITCAPIVIINLLLEKRELRQYIAGEEDSYFCFRFGEKEIWFLVNKNYFSPPQFVTNNTTQ